MDAAARHAVTSASRNYSYFPGVVGVGYGSKFTEGERVADVRSIQFFVTKKRADDELQRSLPRFIFGRRSDGSLDPSRKVPTDVIEVGRLELCCAAGDSLDREGSSGTVSLIFRNKIGADRMLALTCSHVVGDLSVSPAPKPLVGGSDSCIFEATVLLNTTLENNRLEYDIAVTEILGHEPELAELEVSGTATVLDAFVDEHDIALPSTLQCVSRISGARTITLESSTAEFRDIHADNGATITVANLLACQGVAEDGDSGGIVFLGTKAVGFLVARGTNGWVLIHPFRSAVTHLASVGAMPLACFPL